MVVLNKNQVTESSEKNRYAVEASSAGFPPGVWPSTISFENVILARIKIQKEKEDITFAEYANNQREIVVTVYND